MKGINSMIVPTLRALTVLAVAVLGLACASQTVVAQPGGAALFARHCASCHGPVGEGDGPVATIIQVAVPNLRTLRTRSQGTFPRDAVMRYIDGRSLPAAHGDRLMPVWGDSFAGTAADSDANEATARATITAITDYIEQLQN
jgi:mono/diheme cytochrome c family protein